MPENASNAQCLLHAQECRELAARAPNEELRQVCLSLSETWLILANRPPPMPPELPPPRRLSIQRMKTTQREVTLHDLLRGRLRAIGELEGITKNGLAMRRLRPQAPAPSTFTSAAGCASGVEWLVSARKSWAKHLASLFSRYRSTRKALTESALVGFSRPPIFFACRCRSSSKVGPNGPFESGGSAPSPSYIDDFVSSEEGLRLAKAFMQIPRSAVRLRIVALVRELAGEENVIGAP